MGQRTKRPPTVGYFPNTNHGWKIPKEPWRIMEVSSWENHLASEDQTKPKMTMNSCLPKVQTALMAQLPFKLESFNVALSLRMAGSMWPDMAWLKQNKVANI
jgi:hypothetical protein